MEGMCAPQKTPAHAPAILGIWDGHDAGAALIREGRVVCAVNEERLSRRKLEAGFPCRSIASCLASASLSPNEVRQVALSTTDPAKTLTRLFPRLKEEYYLLRRRKRGPGALDSFKKSFKYFFTEWKPNGLSRFLSRAYALRKLRDLGFRNVTLHLVDHHEAHAVAAALGSGFPACLVVTLDGVGDGLCGSLWEFQDQRLRLIRALPAHPSLGIFFEHATNLLNMRELEDEGKVMALANYAYPIADADNPLLEVLRVQDLALQAEGTSRTLYRRMKRILWRYPSEQFAYMAQRTLERNSLALVGEALRRTGLRHVAVAGGVFSNVKMNMQIASLPEVDRFYVFPHMGDGGLAVGAALTVYHRQNGIPPASPLSNLDIGPSFSEEDILAVLRQRPFPHRPVEEPSRLAAELILRGEIVLWFHGGMEYGPRALGFRSILARPDDRTLKDRLNLLLKMRVWYQPFCPSMLLEDADALLHTEGQDIRDNRFMTMAYHVRKARLPLLEGVVNIDGTCRPQFVGDENPPYRDLLRHVKASLGYGVVLNTSFNIHGEPLVCTPGEALAMMEKTGIRHLFLHRFLVENPGEH